MLSSASHVSTITLHSLLLLGLSSFPFSLATSVVYKENRGVTTQNLDPSNDWLPDQPLCLLTTKRIKR